MSFTRTATLNVARVILAGALASLLGLVLAGISFLVALFSQRQVFGTAGILALIVSLLGSATISGAQTYFLFKSGSWTRSDGRRACREQQPKRFATWLILLGTFAAIKSTVAGFLIWNLFASKP